MALYFAETERLRLRTLERDDLPRYAGLIGDWEVSRWLFHVPHPYTHQDAESWLDHLTPSYEAGRPELFVIVDKDYDFVMGAIGLHASAAPKPAEGEIVLGYWLGKPYWGQGFMSEAVPPVLKIALARSYINKITTFTDLNNFASQNVLRKTGFRYLGMGPRVEQYCLRGGEEVTRWEMTREDYRSR